MIKKEKYSAAILVIGDEILSGRTQDTNSNYIAKELEMMGITTSEIRVIPCLLYTSPSPRDGLLSRMPSSA